MLSSRPPAKTPSLHGAPAGTFTASWALLFVPLCLVACGSERGDIAADPAPADRPASTSVAPAPAPPPAPEPVASAAASAPAAPAEIRVEDFPSEEGFVVRGGTGTGKAVLFGGICAQPQGYADAIKIAASRRVQLVALRGDKPCSGEFRGWKFDLDGLSRRIDRTFQALGLGEARDVLLIGYSQGASVAELLAAREPEKYTRVVLMAKPSKPDPWHFGKAKAVATMAGTRDAQQLMVTGSRALAAAGVRSRYFPLPGAAHGYMGDDPEGTFEEVFAWLYDAPAL